MHPGVTTEIKSVLHGDHLQHGREDVTVATPDHMFGSYPSADATNLSSCGLGRAFAEHEGNLDAHAESGAERGDRFDAPPIRAGQNGGDPGTGHVDDRAGDVSGLVSAATTEGTKEVIAVEVGPGSGLGMTNEDERHGTVRLALSAEVGASYRLGTKHVLRIDLFVVARLDLAPAAVGVKVPSQTVVGQQQIKNRGDP